MKEEKIRFIYFNVVVVGAGLLFLAIKAGFLRNFIAMINQWSAMP